MDGKTLFLAFIVLVGWGGGAFIEKLATNRLGSGTVIFWNIVGYAVVSVVYTLFLFNPATLVSADKTGVIYALVSGAIGAVGGIAYFILLAHKDASMVVPLTALYPALTAILAFVFLKESLTPLRVLAIILATVAVYLLSF